MLMYSINLEGFCHREKGKGSQDFVSKVSRRGVNAMALCDGAGSYRFTQLGARRLSARLASYMADQYNNLRVLSDAEIAQRTADVIHGCVEELRDQYGCREADAFASTALCCAMRADTGEYIGVHLGDGLMASVSEQGVFEPLTRSRTYGAGDAFRATVLSTADRTMLLEDLRVIRGVARDSILMASDGTKDLLYYPKLDGYISAVADLMLAGVKACGPVKAEEFMKSTLKGIGRVMMDDASVGLMVLNAHPTPEKLGYCRGQSLATRRRMKSFETYSRCRDRGLSPELAARRAHWGERCRARKIRTAEEILHVG